MSKTIIHDYCIVELDRLFDVREESGLLTLNEAHVQPGERDRNIYKRIYGTITALPRGFSGLKIDPIDPGVPNYKLFVGHDIIQERATEGYKWARETHYHPGTQETYDFVTVNDIAPHVDVRIGDKVYVHPNSLEEENALWKRDEKYYFRVRVDEILCTVRNGEIIAQGRRVFLKPNMETEEDIMRGGLQMKLEPGRKPQQGFVVAARPEFCPRGILVFFVYDADWILTVEDQTLYCMREEEVMCWAEQ